MKMIFLFDMLKYVTIITSAWPYIPPTLPPYHRHCPISPVQLPYMYTTPTHSLFYHQVGICYCSKRYIPIKGTDKCHKCQYIYYVSSTSI